MDDLLFLSQRIPYPPTKGEKIRHLQILRHLSKRYRVHLGCFIDDPGDWRHVETIKELCGECHFARLRPAFAKLAAVRALVGDEPLSCRYFHDAGLAKWTAEILERRRPAVAVICSSVMAQYVVARTPGANRLVIDFCDVDSDKWRQYAETRRGVMRWIYARESRALLEFDRRVGAACDAAIFATRGEAELFGRLAPELAARTCFVSNGVDAVTWFADSVLPLIRRALPALQFHIVGSNPSPTVTRLAAHDGVIVTGRVDDVRPYLAHAAAVVAPLRIANGVQNDRRGAGRGSLRCRCRGHPGAHRFGGDRRQCPCPHA